MALKYTSGKLDHKLDSELPGSQSKRKICQCISEIGVVDSEVWIPGF